MRSQIVSLAIMTVVVSTFAFAQHDKMNITPAPTAPDSKELTEALNSAQKWLKWVDSGKYAKAYKEGSKLFHNTIKQKDWTSKMKAARQPFGKVLGRKKISQQHLNSTQNTPGAPDGEYAIFQFETAFEKKAKAIETVTQLKGKDGKWRAAGYFIK